MFVKGATAATTWLCTPLFKSNRIFLRCQMMVLFSMYRFEIFRVVWWGLLHLLWKISWVYVTASRLCEHSNLVRFEKRAAKTPQHGLRYGNILMFYDIINTFEWFVSAIIDTNVVPVTNYQTFPSCTVFLSNTLLKYQTWISPYPIPFFADMQRAVPVDSGAGTSSYWVMSSYTAISNFSIFWDRA